MKRRALVLGRSLAAVLAVGLMGSPAASDPIYLRAPWNEGQWWQPASYGPYDNPDKDKRYAEQGHSGTGLFTAVDFNRVAESSIQKYGGHWPYADMTSDVNEPTHAVHDGVVVYGVPWNGGNGNYGRHLFVVREGTPVRHESLYAHLRDFSVPNGKRVKAGDVIGYCGSTGAGQAVHLHFEYRINRQRQDTRSFIFDGQPLNINYDRWEPRYGGYVGIPIQASYSPPSLVSLRVFNGQFVCAEGGGGREVVANRDRASSWETFRLIDLNGNELQSGDEIQLQAANGQYVCAEGGGGREVVANRDRASGWETFVILKQNGTGVINFGDTFALRAFSGHYVCAEGGGGREVVANRAAIAGWETFTLIRPGG